MRARWNLLGIALGTGLAALAPLAATAPRAVQDGTPAFHPEQELRLKKSFREESRWTLESMSQRVNGSEVFQELPEFTGQVERSAVVVDEYGPVRGGRPLQLTRELEELAASSTLELGAPGLEETYELRLASALEGESVLFRWQEEEGEYAAELEDQDSAGGPDLAGLVEDLDLRGLLPDGDAAEGDEWEVPAGEVETLFALGGDFLRLPAAAPEGSYVALDELQVLASGFVVPSEVAGDFSGEATAEWTATREVDGRKLAVIEVAIDGTLSAELEDELLRAMTSLGLDDGRSDLEFSLAWSLEGEGELLWDLEAGHFRSFRLESEVEITGAIAWVEDLGGYELEFDGDFRLGGTAVVTASSESAE